MSRLDELPPDQRAALSLLLRQRKSYAEVASLLDVPEQAVRDRAHAALAMLAPQLARALTPEQRAEVGDYLLVQQPGVAERLRTRTLLSSSEPARAWAAELATQLTPLAGERLPEIPGAPAAQAPQRVGDLSASVASATATAPKAAPTGAPSPEPARATQPSSRLGGAVLLAVLVAAVIVAVVLLTGGGSSGKHSSSSNTSKTATTTTKGPKIDAEIPLKPPPGPKSGSVGIVYVLSEGSKRAFFIDAEHLPTSTKGSYYGIWLYNSPSSFRGLTESTVGSNHKMAGGSALPGDAGEFHELLVTRETSQTPKHPGAVVLHGPFSLG